MDVGQGDQGAPLREHLGHREAEPARRARDDRPRSPDVEEAAPGRWSRDQDGPAVTSPSRSLSSTSFTSSSGESRSAASRAAPVQLQELPEVDPVADEVPATKSRRRRSRPTGAPSRRRSRRSSRRPAARAFRAQRRASRRCRRSRRRRRRRAVRQLARGAATSGCSPRTSSAPSRAPGCGGARRCRWRPRDAPSTRTSCRPNVPERRRRSRPWLGSRRGTSFFTAW